MNNFITTIGIEIHIELNTKTKMFSAAPNVFGDAENTNITEIDMAYPGTLPQVNKGAVVRGIKLAKALQMDIDDVLHFDRKNYYYPDLPKGFQITQQERPIGSNGTIPIEVNGEVREISIERIHLEEDTAKGIHQGDSTLLNYNRAGVPLIEIVSNPVMSSGVEAAAYVEAIRSVASSLDISDAKMEEGSLRADINISVRPRGQEELGTKVEIKNMNSIGNIQKAIEHEVQLQITSLLEGEVIQQTTKRFDESIGKPVIMRFKGDAVDYKYFPEPNIPLIKLEKSFIDSIKINELPWERKQRYLKEGIPMDMVEKLMSNFTRANYFDLIDFKDRSKAAKVFFAELVALANQKNIEVNEFGFDPKQVSIILEKQDAGDISGKHVKQIIPLLDSTGMTTNEIIKKHDMKMISDEATIQGFIKEAIENNKEFIEKNSDRVDRVVKFISGQVMKISKGQVNPMAANRIIERELGK